MRGLWFTFAIFFSNRSLDCLRIFQWLLLGKPIPKSELQILNRRILRVLIQDNSKLCKKSAAVVCNFMVLRKQPRFDDIKRLSNLVIILFFQNENQFPYIIVKKLIPRINVFEFWYLLTFNTCLYQIFIIVK